MSPRFASAMTSRPAARAYAQASSNARKPAGTKEGRSRGPLANLLGSCGLVTAAAPAAALDRLLQRAAGRELGHRRRGDRHLLARVARIDALPLLAELGRELPEAGEVDLST